MDVDVSTSVAGNKPQRIRRIQTVTLVLLFMAGSLISSTVRH